MKLIRFAKVCSILICASLSVTASHANELDTLKELVKGFSNFSASFKQVVTDNENKILMEGTGSFLIKQPNKLFWHAQEPDETVMVSDGETLYLHNLFLEQVSIFNTQDAVSSTPFVLLSDPDSAQWKHYNVAQSGEDFVVTALKPDAQVKVLTLKVENNSIKSFEVIDATGQLSQFKLSNINLKANNLDKAFEFVIPEDTEIDDQRG